MKNKSVPNKKQLPSVTADIIGIDPTNFEGLFESEEQPTISKAKSYDKTTFDALELYNLKIDNLPKLLNPYFQKIGFQKNIVVLTQPVGFKKRPMKGMPFFRFFLRRYPKAIEALAHRFVMYNEELDYIRQQELLEQALVIAPDSTLPIGRISHDTEKMKLTYQLGRDAALKRMDQVKEFLNYSAFSK